MYGQLKPVRQHLLHHRVIGSGVLFLFFRKCQTNASFF
jgi:hypothetical protein